MPNTATARQTDPASAGGRLVAVDGKVLPLQRVSLTAEAGGGLARVVLRQWYHNTWDQPLQATYSMPLPAEGAVSGFKMTMGETVILGEIEDREKARQRFDRALIEGRTAGLLDQERSNLFTLQVGNVPPGARVETELVVDQRLDWLDEGASGGWEWRFPTVVAPRFLGSAGRTVDADRVGVDVAGGPTGIAMTLALCIGDDLSGVAPPSSPSHAIRAAGGDVSLAAGDARLDRDVVVRWGAGSPAPGLTLRTARPAAGAARADGACGLLTIVPPMDAAHAMPRDLILLIDTSGSMRGAPMAKAKQVVSALIGSLSSQDRLEMIAFDTAPRRWLDDAVAAGEPARRQALAWVESLRAGGGTDMTAGLEEALRPLRPDAQRQVVLVTDGLIGFESEIVAMLRDGLPIGARLHTVGVGAAVNRALTGPAARAGRGREVMAGLEEPADRAARQIVAATRRPVLMDVSLGGNALRGHAPRHLPDVMSGSPCLAVVLIDPAGGELTVTARGPSGEWRQAVRVEPIAFGTGSDAVLRLYGREAIEDLEIDLAAGGKRGDIDAAILRLGLELQIATRLTSWVAVSREQTVDPHRPVRAVRIPQELPHGLSAEGLGLLPMHDHLVCMSTPVEYLEEACSTMLGRLARDSGPAAPAQTPVLQGRWLSPVEKGLSILELTVVQGTFTWKPKGPAVIHMRDGAMHVIAIVSKRSSRGATLETGELIRVALQIEASLTQEAVRIELPVPGGMVTVGL
jgi:Ca-activated chloride channel homolog